MNLLSTAGTNQLNERFVIFLEIKNGIFQPDEDIKPIESKEKDFCFEGKTNNSRIHAKELEDLALEFKEFSKVLKKIQKICNISLVITSPDVQEDRLNRIKKVLVDFGINCSIDKMDIIHPAKLDSQTQLNPLVNGIKDWLIAHSIEKYIVVQEKDENRALKTSFGKHWIQCTYKNLGKSNIKKMFHLIRNQSTVSNRINTLICQKSSYLNLFGKIQIDQTA